MSVIEVPEKVAKTYHSLSLQAQNAVISRIAQIIEDERKKGDSSNHDPFKEMYKLTPEERSYTYEGEPTDSIDYENTLNELLEKP